MLKAAAERGVKVNVIAFKEVPLLMSRKFAPMFFLSSAVPSFVTNMNEDHSIPHQQPYARLYTVFMDFQAPSVGVTVCQPLLG